MDLESDFIFDDMCDEYWPAIDWMLEECDDIDEDDIPKYLAEDGLTIEQANRVYDAYKCNHDIHCTHA